MLRKVLILLAMAVFLSSCVTSQYSEIGVPGVRQVDQYDDDQHIGTFNQKFCPEAKGWFDARTGQQWRIGNLPPKARKTAKGQSIVSPLEVVVMAVEEAVGALVVVNSALRPPIQKDYKDAP